MNALIGNDYEFCLLSKPLPFSHKRFFLIKFRQLIFRFSTNSPFISCDSFASEADYIAYGLNGKKRIIKRKLKNANILFVTTDKLEQLITHYGHLIKASVILTGNSDYNITKLINLPKSVKVVFAQNCAITAPNNFRLLPIGIENLRNGRSGLKRFHTKEPAQQIHNKIYFPPMAPTNFKRYEILKKVIQNKKYFVIDRHYKDEVNYFKNVKKYKFIFCCEGNGFDVHRIWESLYQGSFPVMLRSKWVGNLAKLNLPILIINDIHEINEKLLVNFLKEFKNFDPANEEKLWIEYWRNLFLSYI